MFGRFGAAIAPTSITFTSESALSAGVPQMLGLKKLVAPVRNCRRIGKKDMIHNSATPTSNWAPKPMKSAWTEH
jgi:urease subunit alpha